MDKVNEGIKVNDVCINNLRYADDTVVFVNNMTSLQRIVNRSGRFSVSLNINKTKYMNIMKK